MPRRSAPRHDSLGWASAVMGSEAGLPAVDACMARFNVMVRGTSQLFPGGPPVVKAALGYDITKEELGGAGVHEGSGVIDNVADSEPEALDMVRDVLAFLPSSVDELPPREPAEEPVLGRLQQRQLVDARRQEGQ